MRIDHVIYGVRDLEQAVERFEADYGLQVFERGTHPGFGTHNAVCPVGYGQFVELLAIADPTSGSPLVAGLKRLLANGDHVAGVCLRAPDLDATAHRLSLRIIHGERRAAGRVLRWRRTAVETDPQFRSSSSGRTTRPRWTPSTAPRPRPTVSLGWRSAALRSRYAPGSVTIKYRYVS